MSEEEKLKLRDYIHGMSPEQLEEIVKHISSEIMFAELLWRDKEREQVIQNISGELKNFNGEKGR